MSFGAIRSAQRLHKWRYGLAAVVAAGASSAYFAWSQAQTIVWSDEYKPDPPLPPKYEYNYRVGSYILRTDVQSAVARTLLNKAWRSALDDGADPAVLTALAAMLLHAEAPADAQRAVGSQTLARLLRAGWDDVHPRERERAITLALAASRGGDDSVRRPFLQWAWAQAWHVAVLDPPLAPESLWLMTRLANASEGKHVLEALPVSIVVAERFEDRRRGPGLGQMQLCFLGQFYNTVALNLLMCGYTWFPASSQFLVRALDALRLPTDPANRKVLDSYKSQISRAQFQMGMVLDRLGKLDQALEKYKSAYESTPDDDPLKDHVRTYMLRTELITHRAEKPYTKK